MKKKWRIVILLIVVLVLGLAAINVASDELLILKYKLKRISGCTVRIILTCNYLIILINDGRWDDAEHCKEVIDYLEDYKRDNPSSVLAKARVSVSFVSRPLDTTFQNYTKDQTKRYEDFCFMELGDMIYDKKIAGFFQCFPQMQYISIGFVRSMEEARFEYLQNPKKIEIRNLNKSEYENFEQRFYEIFPDCEVIIKDLINYP